MIFKFWLWRITFKVNRLDSDKKIEFLTNRLIEEIQASGRNVLNPHIATGFGSLTISAHNIGTDKASMRIWGLHEQPGIDMKPTFKI